MFTNEELAQVKGNYDAYVASGGNRKQTQVKAVPQPQKKKSSWLSLVPSALAAGASLIPGVGTGAAAALGGIGEAGSELLGGQKLNLKNIGEQAALSAVPGGLGKIGKVRNVIKGGETAAEAAPAIGNATKTATQIPVKYTSSLSSGKGATQSANKLLVNPTVGDTTGAAEQLAGKGYSVNGKVGNYPSKATSGVQTTPVVNLQGTKTAVKLQPAGKPTTEILPGTGQAQEKAAAISNGKEVAGLNPVQQPAKQGLVSRIKSGQPETAPSVTAKTGSKIRSANRGIQVGSTVPGEGGKTGLTGERAKELNDAVDRANTGLRSRTVRGQIQNVQKAKAKSGQAIDDAAKAANGTVVSDIARSDAETAIAKGRNKILGFDEKNATHAQLNNRYATRLSEAKSPQEILDARRAFDQAARKVYTNPDATQTVDKELAAVYREQADNMLTKVAPDIKTADKEYSLLSDAEKVLTKNKNIEGQGLDVFKIGSTLSGGRGLGGGAFQALKEGTGKALESAGSANAVPTYSRGLVKQFATRAVAAPVTSALNAGEAPPVTDATTTDTTTPTDTSQILNYHDPNAVLNDQGGTQDQTEQIKSGLQNALVKALADGDSKGITNIVSVIGAMDKLAPAKSSGNLGKVSQQQYALAKSGKQSLAQLTQLLESDPSLAQKNNTPGQGIPLIGNAISNAAGASDYHSLADNILSSLIHLQTGATATSGEITSAHGQLPGPEDPPAVRQRKIQTLLDNFSPFLAGN